MKDDDVLERGGRVKERRGMEGWGVRGEKPMLNLEINHRLGGLP